MRRSNRAAHENKVHNMRKNILIRIGYILIIPLALMLIFMCASDGFSFASTGLVLNQAMLPFVMALGVSFTFIVGIFEMSLGAQVILSAIVGGLLYRYLGVAGLFIGAVGTGLLCGVAMGLVYRFLKIPTMVISLGMLMLFEVIGQLLTVGAGSVAVGKDVTMLGAPPFNFIIAGIAAVIFFIIFHKMRFGYGIRALGCNDYVAVNLGLNNNKLKFKTYLFGGMFYGIAGVLTICYAGSITAKLDLGSLSMMFPPIISVLIGLQLKNIVNIFPVTILIGAYSVTVLASGMIAVGLPAPMQDFITGIFMLVVMIISTNSEKLGKLLDRRKILNRLNKAAE